jgi:hypothetical protein
LNLAGARRQSVRRASVFVFATSNELAVVTARATVSFPKLAVVYRLRTVGRTLGINRRTKFTLAIPRRALVAIRGALRRHRRLTARITVTAKDAAGNRTSKRRAVRLRR